MCPQAIAAYDDLMNSIKTAHEHAQNNASSVATVLTNALQDNPKYMVNPAQFLCVIDAVNTYIYSAHASPPLSKPVWFSWSDNHPIHDVAAIISDAESLIEDIGTDLKTQRLSLGGLVTIWTATKNLGDEYVLVTYGYALSIIKQCQQKEQSLRNLGHAA